MCYMDDTAVKLLKTMTSNNIFSGSLRVGLNGPLVGTLSPWSQSLTMTSHHTSTVPFFKLAASHCILVLGLLTAQLLFPQLGNAADTWPDYRGPRGDGHVAARGDAKMHGIPIHSSDTKTVQWKTRLPLLGLSSPLCQVKTPIQKKWSPVLEILFCQTSTNSHL